MLILFIRYLGVQTTTKYVYTYIKNLLCKLEIQSFLFTIDWLRHGECIFWAQFLIGNPKAFQAPLEGGHQDVIAGGSRLTKGLIVRNEVVRKKCNMQRLRKTALQKKSELNSGFDFLHLPYKQCMLSNFEKPLLFRVGLKI